MDEQSAQKPSAGGTKPAAEESASDKDLSQEIERVVDREPLDLVKCVRVFGNYYRCNWWSRNTGAGARGDFAWTGVIMDFIRKSSFLSATMQAGELVIKVVSPAAASRESQVVGGRGNK
jgi:hypothetical protein